MNLRIGVAGLFIRGGWMTRWLRLVDKKVCDSLVPLIDEGRSASIVGKEMPRRPVEYRTAMAQKHADLVRSLMDKNGQDGLRMGREVMHAAGVELGKQLAAELHLSGSREELLDAAKLLYRILDIEFEMNDGTRMVVKRCSLAERYGALTCEIISAMDEGVFEGLDPRARMTFIRKNSTCPHPCEALLTWEEIA